VGHGHHNADQIDEEMILAPSCQTLNTGFSADRTRTFVEHFFSLRPWRAPW